MKSLFESRTIDNGGDFLSDVRKEDETHYRNSTKITEK